MNTNKKQAILVVSFGTSYNETRELTIGAIEQAIARAYPEYEVRRAFTSGMILSKLKSRDGLAIDNVAEALKRAHEDGIQRLIIQPTHLMDGLEYHDLEKEVDACPYSFESLRIGLPMLQSDDDYTALIDAVTDKMSIYDDGRTAICLMGHGSEAAANQVYTVLQNKFFERGYTNYLVGTVEADPTLDDIYFAVKKNPAYKKVVLLPLMIVAGEHAHHDMSGDDRDSWESVFAAAGYEVTCLIEGLGQLPAIWDIYINHVQRAINADNV